MSTSSSEQMDELEDAASDTSLPIDKNISRHGSEHVDDSGSSIESDQEAKELTDDEDIDDDLSSEEDYNDDDDSDDEFSKEESNTGDGENALTKLMKRPKLVNKTKRSRIAQFIDDEAELSGDDVISEDEADRSDDDQLDTELVDLEAKDLESDEEEEIRQLYHKQLDTDDRRQVLLLQEHLQDNEIAIGQGRRRKFRWQAKEMMENSLKRHYDPDDDDSQEGYDDDFDETDYDQIEPRLRRPVGSLMLGSTKLLTAASDAVDRDFDLHDDGSRSNSNLNLSRTLPRKRSKLNQSGDTRMNEDSNSNTIGSRTTASLAQSNATSSNINRYLFRDKETVELLSTKEVVVATREDKDKVIQRELKRVLQSESIFDQLYS